jgi:hypothetical protein
MDEGYRLHWETYMQGKAADYWGGDLRGDEMIDPWGATTLDVTQQPETPWHESLSDSLSDSESASVWYACSCLDPTTVIVVFEPSRGLALCRVFVVRRDSPPSTSLSGGDSDSGITNATDVNAWNGHNADDWSQTRWDAVELTEFESYYQSSAVPQSVHSALPQMTDSMTHTQSRSATPPDPRTAFSAAVVPSLCLPSGLETGAELPRCALTKARQLSIAGQEVSLGVILEVLRDIKGLDSLNVQTTHRPVQVGANAEFLIFADRKGSHRTGRRFPPEKVRVISSFPPLARARASFPLSLARTPGAETPMMNAVRQVGEHWWQECSGPTDCELWNNC